MHKGFLIWATVFGILGVVLGAFGAHKFGFRVFWVNRTRQPDEYGLRNSATELRDLTNPPL